MFRRRNRPGPWLGEQPNKRRFRRLELRPDDRGYLNVLCGLYGHVEVCNVLDHVERSPASPDPADVLPWIHLRRDGTLERLSWGSGYVCFDRDYRVTLLDFNDGAIVGDRLLVTS